MDKSIPAEMTAWYRSIIYVTCVIFHESDMRFENKPRHEMRKKLRTTIITKNWIRIFNQMKTAAPQEDSLDVVTAGINYHSLVNCAREVKLTASDSFTKN
jgi:hypothetical protein